MNPKISVIVPNYNHDRFLEKRLDSIFDQNYSNNEVILLDDASTDGSLRILQEYSKHEKVSHFVKNEQNSGSPFKQWKKGIDLASGDFIWIAESDDYCEPEFLEKLVPAINKHTALVYSASINVDENDAKIGLNRNQESLDKYRWRSNFSNKGRKEIQHYLKFLNTIPNASAVIFKKELVKSSFFDLELQYCGDWFFWLNLLKFGDVKFISEPLNYFRFHSQSSRSSKNIENDVKMFTEFFKVIRSESTMYNLIRNAGKYHWIVLALNRFSGNYEKDAIFNKLPKRDKDLLRIWGFQNKFNIF